MNTKSTTNTDVKLILKYISTIISWTLFVLLSIIGVLLIYYFISSRLYATKGEKYEPAFSVYTIVSGSMEPTINVYDVIINTKVKNEKNIKVNDVITFTSTNANTAGMTITHRVIGIRELDDKSLCYVTRGDNNTNEDSSCVASKNVIGKVSAVIPGLGRIQFFLASKFGWLCLIVMPALYIIIKDLYKVFKLSRKSQDDYDYDEEDNINKVIKNNNYNKKNKEKYYELVKEIEIVKKDDNGLEENNNEIVIEDNMGNNNLENTILDLPKLVPEKEKKKSIFKFNSKKNLDNTILDLPKLSSTPLITNNEEETEKKKTKVFAFKKKSNLEDTILDLPKLEIKNEDEKSTIMERKTNLDDTILDLPKLNIESEEIEYKIDDEISSLFSNLSKSEENANFDDELDDIELPKFKEQ